MRLSYVAAGLLAAALLAPAAQAQDAPLGGQPPPGTTASVPDLALQVAYQRAFEAVVWAMPASAIYRLRVGMTQVPGMADNVILAYSVPLRPKDEAITPNTVTPYIAAFTDLRSGPVVLDLPAKTDKASLYGQIVDAWQATIADVGPAGLDKGAGAKYLLIPPDYKRPVPDGYLPIRTRSYRIALAFRSVRAPTATDADAYAYTQTLKMYPLSQAANPPPTRFVDGRTYNVHTLPFYDIRALEDIHDIIDVEPVQPQDKVMMGMLASIGIERGKPFAPQGAMKAALEHGVADAYFYMHDLDTKLFASHLYWPDRHWSFVMVPDAAHGFDFVTDDAVQVDQRAAAWHFFTFYPKTLSERVGTVYLAPTADSAGRPLEAGKTYRLTVPANTPVKQFWSLTLYDEATWALIPTPVERGGLSSFEKDRMAVNSDGSVTLYFGPTAPKGLESNWIPTDGKKPYALVPALRPG